MPKSSLSASSPLQRANCNIFVSNTTKNLKMFKQIGKSCEKDLQNTSQTPPQTSPNPIKNNVKNPIEKNIVFNIVFFIIWHAQNMKNVVPVEAKRYILQKRRFRNKYKNNLPKHP
jgi:hypothetical protein